MINKLFVFDIDQTFYDSYAFLDDLFEKLKKEFGLEEGALRKIYEGSKPDNCFNPRLFLEKISAIHEIEIEKLNKIFWDEKNIEKFLYPDANLLFEFKKKVKMIIFSKGDLRFHKLKIVKFEDLFDDVYIYTNKIEKIPEVFNAYKSYKIYVVDDNMSVLESIKKYDRRIFTILIDRKNLKSKNDKIDTQIKGLKELKHLL